MHGTKCVRLSIRILEYHLLCHCSTNHYVSSYADSHLNAYTDSYANHFNLYNNTDTDTD
jgi:hypothetical protein